MRLLVDTVLSFQCTIFRSVPQTLPVSSLMFHLNVSVHCPEGHRIQEYSNWRQQSSSGACVGIWSQVTPETPTDEGETTCIKGRVDKSRAMVTLIPEAFAKIKATEPLRWAKQAARRKWNWSDSWVILRPKHFPHDEYAVRKASAKKSSYKRPDVFTATGMNTIGSGTSAYNLF
jgi:hypothetical protein